MRPLGLGETLDACFTLVRRHFKALALVVIIVTIPVEVVSFFIATSTATIQDGQVTYDRRRRVRRRPPRHDAPAARRRICW